MGRTTKFFLGQTRLVGTTGCGVRYILTEDGESLPEGKSLEGKDNLCPALSGNILNQ